MTLQLQLLLVLILGSSPAVKSTWWYLSQFSQESVENPRILCQVLQNIHPEQRRMCHRRSDVILTIGESTRNAISECQFQFRSNKWNCSTFRRDSSVFGQEFIKGGTRELAFVQALTTASAVLSVSKACSAGQINCGCTLKTVEESIYNSKDFKWHGCSESTRFGLNFVRRFVDSAESFRSDPKAKTTIYNNKAGREALLRHSITKCKCHGLSGSCTMRTCWRFLPSFRIIGDALKEQYDEAIKIEFDPKGQMITVDNLQRKPTRANLIYFEDSPDGCVVDPSRGLLGTQNRICNVTSEGIDSCDILCCGRGFDSFRLSVSYSCECTFIWCCKVECKTCHEWKAESRCKQAIEKMNSSSMSQLAHASRSSFKKKPTWLTLHPASNTKPLSGGSNRPFGRKTPHRYTFRES